MPSAAAADLLADILPVASGTNAATLRKHTLGVAERAEAKLDGERVSFMEGRPADWQKLPFPEGRVVVRIDGGDVRDWGEKKTNFGFIVARSMPEELPPRSIGLAHGYDTKPTRRLVDVLASQASRPSRTSPS